MDCQNPATQGEPAESPPRMSVVEAQDALAALIPEVDTLAWKFFVISRSLGVDLNDEETSPLTPGPEQLRWHTALGALATYNELTELLPYIRKNIERTASDLAHEYKMIEERERLSSSA